MPTQIVRKPMTMVRICFAEALRPWNRTTVVTIEQKVTNVAGQQHVDGEEKIYIHMT